MRDLTEEELKLAPDWAIMYSITSSDNIRFHDECIFCLCNGHAVSDVVSASTKNFSTRMIIRKPFDITKHEFNDFKVLDAEVPVNKRKLRLNFDSLDFHYADLSKDDAIAIAKALGVTAKDLA